MSEKRLDSVTFKETDKGDAALTVTRVTDYMVEKYAPKILGVMHGAYMRRFVDELGILSAEAVDKQFAVTGENKLAQIERMDTYMNRYGSSYWVARPGHYPSDDLVIGVAKASPSRPRKLLGRFQTPNMYINDIDSLEERQGVASALLYAASFDFEPDRLVVLDAVYGNGFVNEWFERLGFEAGAQLSEPLEIGGAQLNQVRYENKACVRGLKLALEASQPWLREGLKHFAHA